MANLFERAMNAVADGANAFMEWGANTVGKAMNDIVEGLGDKERIAQENARQGKEVDNQGARSVSRTGGLTEDERKSMAHEVRAVRQADGSFLVVEANGKNADLMGKSFNPNDAYWSGKKPFNPEGDNVARAAVNGGRYKPSDTEQKIAVNDALGGRIPEPDFLAQGRGNAAGIDAGSNFENLMAQAAVGRSTAQGPKY